MVCKVKVAKVIMLHINGGPAVLWTVGHFLQIHRLREPAAGDRAGLVSFPVCEAASAGSVQVHTLVLCFHGAAAGQPPAAWLAGSA